MSAIRDTRRCAYGCDHLAAHGSQVCPRCETFTERTLADLAQTYADLIDPRLLQLPGRSGGDKPPMVGDRAVEGRAQIRGVLVTWCKLLEEDETAPNGFVIRKGVHLPEDNVPAMAAHVLRHHLRILASDAAEALVTDCADLARITAWPARPTGVRVQCPCGATVRITVETAAGEIRCPDCDEWGTVDFWRKRVKAEEWRPMNVADVVSWLILAQGMSVNYKQVYKWITTADLQGYMLTEGGRVLYDPNAVLLLGARMMRRAA